MKLTADQRAEFKDLVEKDTALGLEIKIREDARKQIREDIDNLRILGESQYFVAEMTAKRARRGKK